ncbi:rod-binding protein [Paucibacter sp. PLA-PC-4]|uniref:rod-binding protein n=1 Tax=Paucibacter sp. PLA-PC-4 TaxID=2993655 RepID=UPI0022495516|nr:rod-binding protein [Paucibacter sp. PLA-PC-4]MCX2861684.1 rod-binding protein [Paucibacter sp. PLA-PC-4]
MKLDTQLNPAAPGATPGADADAVRLQTRAAEAAEKFEAFFIKQMMSQMRSATRALADDDSPLKNKVNEDMMDMADGLVADAMAGQRAFGIADLMLKQILPPAGLSPAAVRSPSQHDESKQGSKP